MSPLSPQQVTLLISLKGAPASILLALLFQNKRRDSISVEHQPNNIYPTDNESIIYRDQFSREQNNPGGTQKRVRQVSGLGTRDLAIITGWSIDQVTRGLQTLSRIGLIEQHGRYNGWQLTSLVEQLVLPLNTEKDRTSNGEPVPPERQSQHGKVIPYLSPLPVDSNPTTITINNMKEHEQSEGVIVNGSPFAADSTYLKINEFDLDHLDTDLKKAFYETGIGLNWRTLHMAQGITAEDVRREYANLRKRGKGDQTGLLITILEKIASGQARHHSSYSDWNQ